MIAKLIVHAQSRPACIMRAGRALDEFVIEGVKTTIPLQQKLLKNRDVKTLNFDNHWLESYLKSERDKAAAKQARAEKTTDSDAEKE